MHFILRRIGSEDHLNFTMRFLDCDIYSTTDMQTMQVSLFAGWAHWDLFIAVLEIKGW